jgi:hypothetical protein
MLRNNQLRAKKGRRETKVKGIGLLQKSDGKNCLTAEKICLTTSDSLL